MTDLDEQAIRERHHMEWGIDNGCDNCGKTWPCDAIRALDALAAERKAHEETRNELEDAKLDYRILSSDYRDLQEDLYRVERMWEEETSRG